MKSKIKKEQVLQYLMDKLNNNYYGVPFYMGTNATPIYRPSLDTNGNIIGYEFVDEETYQVNTEEKIPVGIIVSNGDYAVIKSLDSSDEINSASFSATLLFLVPYWNMKNAKVYLQALEQVRDKMLGNFETFRASQFNETTNKTTKANFMVATHCDDLDIGGQLTLNGKDYIEYMLTINLDISDDISYGNQYTFYMANYKKEWVISDENYFNTTNKEKIILDQSSYTSPQPNLFPNVDTKEFNSAIRVKTTISGGGTLYTYYRLKYIQQPYERILPLVSQWGSGQALSGFQMLRKNLTSSEDIKKAQMIHSIASTRGWAITLTMQLQETKEVVTSLFAETLPRKENLQLSYKLKAIYLKKDLVNGEIQFTPFEKLGFELNLIPQDSGTDIVYGDNINFTISLSPYWGDING